MHMALILENCPVKLSTTQRTISLAQPFKVLVYMEKNSHRCVQF